MAGIIVILRIFLNMCTCVSVYVHACRGQKRAADVLELELLAVVRYPVSTLGPKLGSPGREFLTTDIFIQLKNNLKNKK